MAHFQEGRLVGHSVERERDDRRLVEFQRLAGLIVEFIDRPWEAGVVGDLPRGFDSL